MERAILINCFYNKYEIELNNDRIRELELLTKTAGGEVIKKFNIHLKRINPAYFLTKGKLENISSFLSNTEADIIIFNNELKPVQVRNLNEYFKIKVIGRTELILDIFSLRARTKEAKIQVELAQLRYLLPRLAGYGVMMSRLGGGIGTRGPGEKEIEYDRRHIMKRISVLTKKLKLIEKHRKNISKNRPFKVVSIVGYTNAGKSTLLNALAKENLKTENRLFVTLDSTIRKIYLSNNKFILLSDTVGFIRDIPHHLIASFKSTLSEAKEADLLLHLIDINDEFYTEKIEVVNNVLRSIGIDISKSIYVFNKIDKIANKGKLERIKNLYSDALFISAKNKINHDKLKENIIFRLEI